MTETSHPSESEEHSAERIHREERGDTLRMLAEVVRTLVVVVLLAGFLRFFIIQPFKVDGLSMYPRFTTNDYLIVDKVSYRFGAPSRGDIIVFRYPNDPTTNYVKRIIGLPGEEVRIEDGKVRIINSSHPDGFILDENQYLSNEVRTSLTTAGKETFQVSQGHYFVMGDNRTASSDSRAWGLLPRENIIGRVIVQVFPIDHFSLISHARYQE